MTRNANYVKAKHLAEEDKKQFVMIVDSFRKWLQMIIMLSVIFAMTIETPQRT